MNGILLDLLAFGSVLSGILVITSRNPIISVLFLISVFVNVACYLILFGINFIGILYIVIYVGAIAILFLFVIMIINVKLAEIQQVGIEQYQHAPLGVLIGILFVEIIPNFSVVGTSSLFYFFDSLNNVMSNYLGDSTRIENSVFYSMETIKNLKSLGISWDSQFIRFDQIESLGPLLYSSHMLSLLLCTVILLLVMVGSIILTLRPKKF
jgi:NADH-ubiquinone oxidoreductase chain 6